MSYESLKAESIGWWDMQEESGIVCIDQSSNSNDGVLQTNSDDSTGYLGGFTGPTAWLPNAYQFDNGMDSLRRAVRFEVPGDSVVLGSNARTYAGWIKPVVEDIAHYFLQAGNRAGADSNGSAFSLGFSWNNGPLQLNIRGATARSTNTAGIGNTDWFHWTIRVPEGATVFGDIEVFVNGIQEGWIYGSGGESTAFSTAFISTSKLYFGGTDEFAAGQAISCAAAQAAGFTFFDRALSDAEIMTLVTATGGEDGGGSGPARRTRPLGLGGNLGLRR